MRVDRVPGYEPRTGNLPAATGQLASSGCQEERFLLQPSGRGSSVRSVPIGGMSPRPRRGHSALPRGPGYAYLLTDFLPLLIATGLDEEEVRRYVTVNPRAALTGEPPR